MHSDRFQVQVFCLSLDVNLQLESSVGLSPFDLIDLVVDELVDLIDSFPLVLRARVRLVGSV